MCGISGLLALARLVVPFLALYVSELGYSNLLAGVLVAAYGGGAALSSITCGVFSDLVGRTPILIGSIVGGIVVCLVAAFGSAAHTIFLACLMFAFGWCVNGPQTVINALIADKTSATNRRAAFALNTWARNAGFAVGPAIIGIWIGGAFSLMFVLQASLSIVAIILIAVGVRDAWSSSAWRGPQHSRVVSPLPRDLVLYCFVGCNFVFTLIFAQFSFGLPLSVADLGYGERFYAVLMGINALVLVLFQLPIQRHVVRFSAGAVLVAGALTMACSYAVVGLSDLMAMYAVMMVAWSAAEAMYMPTADYVVAAISDQAARGRYQGVHKTVFFFGQLGGPLMAGWLLSSGGVHELWLICAGLGGLVGLGMFLLRHRLADRAAVHVGTDCREIVFAAPPPDSAALPLLDVPEHGSSQ